MYAGKERKGSILLCLLEDDWLLLKHSDWPHPFGQVYCDFGECPSSFLYYCGTLVVSFLFDLSGNQLWQNLANRTYSRISLSLPCDSFSQRNLPAPSTEIA